MKDNKEKPLSWVLMFKNPYFSFDRALFGVVGREERGTGVVGMEFGLELMSKRDFVNWVFWWGWLGVRVVRSGRGRTPFCLSEITRARLGQPRLTNERARSQPITGRVRGPLPPRPITGRPSIGANHRPNWAEFIQSHWLLMGQGGRVNTARPVFSPTLTWLLPVGRGTRPALLDPPAQRHPSQQRLARWNSRVFEIISHRIYPKLERLLKMCLHTPFETKITPEFDSFKNSAYRSDFYDSLIYTVVTQNDSTLGFFVYLERNKLVEDDECI